MKETELFVVQVAAALEAARVWRMFREVERTQKAHRLALREAARDPALIEEEWATAEAVSKPVLRTMADRVDRMWSSYEMKLVERIAHDLDQATDQLLSGVYRELDRIRSLTGSIPTRKLSEWWRKAERL